MTSSAQDYANIGKGLISFIVHQTGDTTVPIEGPKVTVDQNIINKLINQGWNEEDLQELNGKTISIDQYNQLYNNYKNQGANKVINDNVTDTDLANVISGYNDKIDELNDRAEREAEKERQRLQSNFETEMDFAERQFRESQAENALTRSREDTYYQRMVADLEAAGINPLMAGKLGGAGVHNGIIAGNAPGNTSAVTPSYTGYESSANAVASNLASKRASATEEAKIELDYERLKSSETTTWAQINQGYELFKGESELKKELANFERRTKEITEELKTKGQKELQKDAQTFEKSLFDLEYELKERGQWLDFGAKIGTAALGLVGDIFAFKHFKLPRNFGRNIPNIPESEKKGPASPGWTPQKSEGGIYY